MIDSRFDYRICISDWCLFVAKRIPLYPEPCCCHFDFIVFVFAQAPLSAVQEFPYGSALLDWAGAEHTGLLFRLSHIFLFTGLRHLRNALFYGHRC